MNLSLHGPIAPGKKIAAWVCLLAALLLWAPLWAAALQSNGMACCNGVMCSVQDHTKLAHQRASTAANQPEQPMHCEHSSGNSLMSCDMSCCPDQGQTFVASIQFVLPPSPLIVALQHAWESAPAIELAQVLHSLDPLFPPPRTSTA